MEKKSCLPKNLKDFKFNENSKSLSMIRNLLMQHSDKDDFSKILDFG